jgi:hypothetical protein
MQGQRRPTGPPTIPIACRIDALDADERRRHATLLRDLLAGAADLRRIPGGWAATFPEEPAVLTRLSEWVGLEKRCCPFLRFRLDYGAGRTRLRVTGPREAAQVLADALAAARAGEV